MIVIANSQKYGTGVTINPNGAMDDGKFELVILKKFRSGCTWKIISGNTFRFGRCRDISTDKANSTNVPSFQIDGEYCGSETNLNIEILPKQFKCRQLACFTNIIFSTAA
jgi:diacylglycerol kinase family enzyme